MDKNIINKVMTFTEAEDDYGLLRGRLKRYVNYPTKDKKIKEGIDYRKSGNTWLITKEGIEKFLK